PSPLPSLFLFPTRRSSDLIPSEPLGFFPTPLIELKRLSEALGGPKIYMKRDDNTGLALGGNKTRKLEFILGDALAKGADTIITADRKSTRLNSSHVSLSYA